MRTHGHFLGALLGAALAFTLHAQTPVLQWAESVSNIPITDNGTSSSVAVADDGAVYITGAGFGPEQGDRIVVGNNIVGRSHLSRFDSTGNVVWARSPGGGDVATMGNTDVYVTGTFTGTEQFGANSFTADGYDAYVLRYDAAGNMIWARQIGGALTQTGTSIATDGLGRIHVAGFFEGSITIGSITLTATQDTTGFLATYDDAGNVLWAVLAGGITDPTALFSYPEIYITADDQGRTYAIGSVRGTGTFGTLSLTSTGPDLVFLACYESNGTCAWVEGFGGQYNRGADLRITPAGNIYVLGEYNNDATFDGIPVPNINFSPYENMFLALYNANGACQWAQAIGVTEQRENAISLDVDASGDAWITGDVGDTLSTFGTITLQGEGAFLARYNEAGTAELATQVTTAFLTIALGLDNDIYLTGVSSAGGVIFNLNGGPIVGPALDFDGRDGFLAHYDQNLEYDWMRQVGAHRSAYDGGQGIVRDAGGNVYTTGYFNGSAIFCNDTLHEFLAGSCIFLSKRDAAGSCLWTRHIGTRDSLQDGLLFLYSNTGNAIALDALGNVLVAGAFSDTAMFGATQLVSAGGTDLFLAKYDANGNCLWAQRGGGAGNDVAQSVGVDASGIATITGSYRGSASIGSASFTSQGLDDGFIARYDAAGNFLWARSMGGTGVDTGVDVAVDATGNSYVIGVFTTSATFGTTTLNGTGTRDLFLANYDVNGDPLWVKGSTGTGTRQGTSLVLGANGQLYITGSFFGSVDLGTVQLTGDPVDGRAFLASYTTSGTDLWVQQFQVSGSSSGHALAARPGGDVVLVGGLSGTATFGTTTLSTVGLFDMMVAGFNAAGTPLWAKSVSGTSADACQGVGLWADAQSVFLTGGFGGVIYWQILSGGSVSFDPGDPNATLFAPNMFDVFVAKYDVDESVSIAEANAASVALTISPNPVDRAFTLTSDAPLMSGSAIIVRDMTGRTVPLSFTIHSGGATIDASGLAQGAYTITVRTSRGAITQRFIKE